MVVSHSRVRLSLLLLASLLFASVIFLMVQTYQNEQATPAESNTEEITEQAELTPMALTDKAELPQSELIKILPSEEVVSAESALPAPSASGYSSACNDMRTMYTNEFESKKQAENQRHTKAKQAIINRYSQNGMSFSGMQKSATGYEDKIHAKIMSALQTQYDRQIAGLRC